MIRLESHVEGRWQAGSAAGRAFVNPTTGEALGTLDSTGIDAAAAVAFARAKGLPALQAMSFAERGALLNTIADALIANRAAYGDIARLNSGNTLRDAAIDIDGGIGTLKFYARLGKQLGAARHLIEPGQDQLSKAEFFARHVWTSRPGIAIHINQRLQLPLLGPVGEGRGLAARRCPGDRQARQRHGLAVGSDDARRDQHRRGASGRAFADLRRGRGPCRGGGPV